MVGQTAYFVLRTDEGGVARITGRVVEEKSDTLVAAVHPSDSLGLKHRLTSRAPGDSTEISFLRVPLDSCAYTRPTNWRGRDPGSLPAGELCLAAWGEVGKEVLISSEAERAPKGNPSKSSGSALAAELEKMQDMFKGSESESSGSDSEAVARTAMQCRCERAALDTSLQEARVLLPAKSIENEEAPVPKIRALP